MVDALFLLLTVVAGVGCIGYVAMTWVLHFVNAGQYLAVAALASVLVTVSAFAAVRVPIALLLFFGTAAVLASAFSMGAGNVVLP